MIDWFLGQAFFAFFSQKRGSTSPRANRDCRGESARRRRNVRLKASPAPPATACQHEAREILKSVARPQRGALHEVEEAVRDFPKPQIFRYARSASRPVPARVERAREIFARAKSGRGFSSATLLSAPICDFVENLNHALADFPVLRLAAAADPDAADNLAA